MNFSRYSTGSWQHQRRNPVRTLLHATWIAALLTLNPAHADDDAPSYDRPGLGFVPRALNAGAVTWEQGVPDWTRQHDDGSTSSLYTADSLLRLGIGHALELQLGDSFWNRLRTTGDGPGYTRVGRGDSNLALKYTLPSANPDFIWGLLGSIEFTDGARAFRNPHKQYLLGLDIGIQADEKNNIGIYVQDLRAGGSDSQIAALNDNYQINRQWTIYAEAALEHDVASRTGMLAGAGVTWQVSRRVQLDGSFRHRLYGEVDDWEAGLGASIYFGH